MKPLIAGTPSYITHNTVLLLYNNFIASRNVYVLIQSKSSENQFAQKKHGLNEHLSICPCDLSMKEQGCNLKARTKTPFPG